MLVMLVMCAVQYDSARTNQWAGTLGSLAAGAQAQGAQGRRGAAGASGAGAGGAGAGGYVENPLMGGWRRATGGSGGSGGGGMGAAFGAAQGAQQPSQTQFALPKKLLTPKQVSYVSYSCYTPH